MSTTMVDPAVAEPCPPPKVRFGVSGILLLSAVLACVLLLVPSGASAQVPPIKRVLLLHEGGGSGTMRSRFDVAFNDAIRSADSTPMDLYEETIESRYSSRAGHSTKLRAYLRDKYAALPIDVIVAQGSAPLTFAQANRALFGNPPIVAIVASPDLIPAGDRVTGLHGGFWVNGTLDLAQALRPDTDTVYVIDGARENSPELQKEIERQLKERRHPVTLVYLRDLPLLDLLVRVAAIPGHSIVLFVKQTMRTASEDVDQLDALARVVAASPVPVFSPLEEAVGRGVLGGYIWQYEADAKRLAQTATRVAHGEPVPVIPSSRATYANVLDWRQLRRWNVPEARVPAGTVIQFREESFFEQYRRYIVGGSLIILVQLVLIVALLTQRVQKQRAEAQTRTSEARYRSVVETQSDLICRFLPDTTLTFVNDAYCRFWNRRPEELLGTKFIDLIPESARPEVLERLRALGAEPLAHEHAVLLADGSTGWHHWINHAIADTGVVAEFQGVGRDITDRKRAEEALRNVETRNSAMLRAIPDLMFVLDRDGTYVDYHARDPRLLFVPPERFLGKKIADVMPPDLAERFETALEAALAHGEPVVVTYELEMEDRRYFEARLVSAGPGTVLSIVRDVTESRRAQELTRRAVKVSRELSGRVQQADAANRDLAGRLIASQEAERQRVARELHDDVSQKVALLNIEIDRLATRAELKGYRAHLQRLSTRASEIATDVHNLSHELHPSKLHALGLVTTIEILCRDVALRGGVHIDFSHDTLPEPIDADVSLCLYRVTQEALHNVVKHSRARQATVRLSSDEDYLLLHVADSGIGFDAEHTGHGGLGLVSMRERVGFLKGHLVVRSRHGDGTRIGVRIPRTPSAQVLTSEFKSA
jgi:PAS domain S-box-containing protein